MWKMRDIARRGPNTFAGSLDREQAMTIPGAIPTEKTELPGDEPDADPDDVRTIPTPSRPRRVF